MSSTYNTNKGGFNDLNFQLSSNLQHANGKGLQAPQIMNSNQPNGFRGYSRSSNTRGATQGHGGLAVHPGTSNSQKRQTNGDHNVREQGSNGLNIKLIRKRVGPQGEKNLEYMPITTTSYTTTQKTQANPGNKSKNNSEFKLRLQGNEASSIRYSSLISNTATHAQNLAPLGINGLAVQNPTKSMTTDLKKMGMPLQNQRINNEDALVFENIALQSLAQPGPLGNMKSKAQLQTAKQTIDQGTRQTKLRTNMEAQNNATNAEVVSPKPQMTNTAQQLKKNTVSVMAEHAKPPSSSTNAESTILPSLTNQAAPQGPSQSAQSSGKPASDHIRKLAYAAQSGAMQISSNPPEGMQFQQYNSSNNLGGQQIGDGNAYTHHNHKNSPTNKSYQTAGQINGVIIPPPSNLGIHKPHDGHEDRDSYFQRRQLIQVQKDKKNELFKHLDQNNKILAQNVVRFPAPGRGIHEQDGINPMTGSGSSYMLGSSQVAQNQYNSQQVGQAPIVSSSFNPTLRSTQKALNKDSNITSGANSSMANHISSAGPSVINKQLDGHSVEGFLNQKRRMNMLSYVSDPLKSTPFGQHQPDSNIGMPVNMNINVKTQTVKYRAPDMQNQFQHNTSSKTYELKSKQNGVVCISGKQIAFAQSNNNAHLTQQLQVHHHALLQNSNATSHQVTTEQLMNQFVSNNLMSAASINGQGQSTITQRYDQGQQNGQIQNQNNVNCQITRKLDAGRPHKIYDYMFIQMSNEQFRAEYEQKKIFVTKNHSQLEHETDLEKKKQTMLTPNKFKGGGANEQQNLDGLVKIKAYDNMVTDELPLMQCNLLPTQLDHVKLLICEQEDKNYPKLTPEAAARFEVEKQNQIKQYMEDIIIKLQQKERKFKVTVKKKFIEDALYNSTSIRVASVYVVVVNREKTFDPLMGKQFIQKHKRLMNDMKNHHDESSDDEDELAVKTDIQRLRDNLRRSANPNLIHQKKTSMYESDNNAATFQENNDSNKMISNFKNFQNDRPQDESHRSSFKNRVKPMPTAQPNLKSKMKNDDQQYYKYVPPAKDFPKYKETKIKICQDITLNTHYRGHPINVFTHQYNEFVRLVFKNQKTHPQQKFNAQYAMGLGRTLGLNLKKDTFSEQNMKSREHICMLKEKLIYAFWKRVFEENKDVVTDKEKSALQKTNNDPSENELDGGNSIDSTIASSNTPRSKSLGVNLKSDAEHQDNNGNLASNTATQSKVATNHKDSKGTKDSSDVQWTMPHPSVIYKYVIGKGNNSMMVRNLFKNRNWWVQGDESDNKVINFHWTQNKVQKILESMACKFPQNRSGNKFHEFSQMQATPQQPRSVKKKKLLSSEAQKKDTMGAPGTVKHSEAKLYNKIEDNYHMNNKKALFLNMKQYYEAIDEDVFDNLPLTFHIKTGLEDPEFKRFEQFYKQYEDEINKNKKQKRKDQSKTEKPAEANGTTSPICSPSKDENGQKQNENPQTSAEARKEQAKTKETNYYKTLQPQKNIWIIKPGENTNRGHGIQVAKELDEIKEIIADSCRNSKKTCILQKYIHNPLLINKRKFDIRTFVLYTSCNGNQKAYIYEEGYLRTSCREYSINNLNNKLVHLTNDAVQKMSQDYGKFEPGNKLSYNEFQGFLDKNYPDLNICYERDLIPQMNKMTVDILRACHGKLDPKRRLNCMEVFGLDFMIDDEFRLYLIEVNTNPCLELSCPLLARLIPTLIENALKIGCDSVFIPPEGFSQKKAFIGDPCPENRYTLVYDEKVDGPQVEKLQKNKHDIIVEMDDEEFSDDEDVHDDAEDE